MDAIFGGRVVIRKKRNGGSCEAYRGGRQGGVVRDGGVHRGVLQHRGYSGWGRNNNEGDDWDKSIQTVWSSRGNEGVLKAYIEMVGWGGVGLTLQLPGEGGAPSILQSDHGG
eukprot:766556-Hanusia_phi.AAC.1